MFSLSLYDSLLQQLCEEWNSRSEVDKQFKPFHTAVNNLVSAGATITTTHHDGRRSIGRQASVVLTQVIRAELRLTSTEFPPLCL